MGHSVKFEHKKRHLSPTEVQSLLKDEVAQLQKELKAQNIVRSALEKAISCQPLVHDPTYKSLSRPAEDLINEIALLELEVVYLEKYLLSMYRRNFAKRLSTLSAVAERQRANAEAHAWTTPFEASKTNLRSVDEGSVVVGCHDDTDILGADTLVDAAGICRSQSSLSHYSASSFRASPPFEAVAEGVDEYHSLPLSMLERTSESTSNSNRAETPNWMSEEMIKCISTVYCHLSDPPLGEPFSQRPTSSEEKLVFNSLHNNPPFHVEPSNGSFFTMVEVQGLLRDSQHLSTVENLLQNYRSLISKLGQVDPGKLKHEEKLAFWINVHNALVMHAFLVYGIPRGHIRRTSLILKAAYNIGGHTVSIETIQSSFLGCRLPRPNQWLQSLFFPKTKFKSGDPRKAYAVKHPEPRLHFALCSGCQSDPPVRIYTAKKVFQELEMAKEEYIQMNVKLQREQRLSIPKNVEHYIKETGLSSLGLSEMLEHSIPDLFRKHGKLGKKIDWINHNFTFRFLLSNEVIVG